MIRRLGVCIFLLFASLRSLAIDAVVSHSVFYLPDPSHGNRITPNLEIYWQINQRYLHFTTTPDKSIIARIKTDVVFMNEKGIVRQDHFIMQTAPCKTPEELSALNIIDLRKYFLPPGFTKMKFVLTDMADSTNKYVYSDSFTLATPASDKPFYSDIQLLDTVVDLPTETVFKKNGRQHLPLCANFFDDKKNKIRYYAELYGSIRVSKDDYPLIQKVYISKKEKGSVYVDYVKKDTLAGSELMPVSGSLPITYLPSGNYYLNIILENKARQVLASSASFFQRMNTRPPEEDTSKKTVTPADTGMEQLNVLNLDKTFVAKYTLPEIRAILKMLLPFSDYTATQTIENFLKKPEELYMRYYVYNYFQSVNPKDPKQAWKEFSEKIREANKLYTSHGTAGYETERGFMFLRYGPPTDVVTVENEAGALPYEVWQYNTLRLKDGRPVTDAVFLFYRPNQNIFDFKLLHTSVPGELINPGWRSVLYTNAQGGNNGNSAAEQIIGNK